METITRKCNGAVIGSNFKDGVIYRGSIEDYTNWLENIECSLEGETYVSDGRKIPFGEGENYTIFSDSDPVYFWVNTLPDDIIEWGIYEQIV